MSEVMRVSYEQLQAISRKTYAEALADDWTVLLQAIRERDATIAELRNDALSYQLQRDQAQEMLAQRDATIAKLRANINHMEREHLEEMQLAHADGARRERGEDYGTY